MTETQAFWTPAPEATGYDVALGSIELLGNYNAATLGCVGDDHVVPALGEGFWVLVRPVNCGGNGGYGNVQRDSGVLACP